MTQRTFARDTEDKKIAGIASGLAKYYDINVNYVRLGFIALAIIPPNIGIFIYPALLLIMSPAPNRPAPYEEMQQQRQQQPGDTQQSPNDSTGQ